MKQEEIVPYNLRLPKKLKVRAERLAKAEKRSLNKSIILALEQYIQQNSLLEKSLQKS